MVREETCEKTRQTGAFGRENRPIIDGMFSVPGRELRPSAFPTKSRPFGGRRTDLGARNAAPGES